MCNKPYRAPLFWQVTMDWAASRAFITHGEPPRGGGGAGLRECGFFTCIYVSFEFSMRMCSDSRVLYYISRQVNLRCVA